MLWIETERYGKKTVQYGKGTVSYGNFGFIQITLRYGKKR
jgi:hypothetical protein